MSAECTSFLVDMSQRMIETGKIPLVVEYLEYTLLEKFDKSRKTDWIDCYLNNCSKNDNVMNITGIIQLQEMVAPIQSSDIIRIIKTISNMEVEKTDDADELSTIEQCLILSILQIKKEFRKKNMIRQIMCFTDDLDSIHLEDDEIDQILGEYQGRFILVDCRTPDQIEDDANDGIAVEDNAWFKLINRTAGSMMVHITELNEMIQSPIPSAVKPVRVFSGQLRLGADINNINNPSKSMLNDNIDDTNCLCINVEGYPATKSVSSSHRKLVQEIKDEDGNIRYDIPTSTIEYEIYPNEEPIIKDEIEGSKDEKAKGIPVSKQGVTKAYRYGSDYVTLPATIANQIYNSNSPGLDIRGFMDQKDLPRRYLNSESTFILADTRIGNMGDVISVSALVDTLIRSNKVAICRYVQKTNSEVQMVVLVPLIITMDNLKNVTLNETIDSDNKGLRVLILNRLPFAEDERMTTSKRKIPTTIKTEFQKIKKEEAETERENKEKMKLKQIDELMSNFIDSMSLNDKFDTPSELYYEHIDEIPKMSSLPLPRRQFENVYNLEDPLRMGAIGPFSNKQLLINGFNQIKIMNQTDPSEFIPPNLYNILAKKINPLDSVPNEIKTIINENIEQIVSLTGIKKIEANTKSKNEELVTDVIADFVSTEQAPPLDDILARGRRD